MFSLQQQIRSFITEKVSKSSSLWKRIFTGMKISQSYQSYQAILLMFHSATVKPDLLLSNFQIPLEIFPRKAFRWSSSAVSFNGDFFTKRGTFQRSEGWSQKFFRGRAPGLTFLLASLAFGSSTPNMNSLRTGLTIGPHPRKIVLFMVANMDTIRAYE